MDQLQKLYTDTLSAFARIAEVQEIFLFGSFAQQQHDRYSDVDLHIVSSDFQRTIEHLTSILEHIDNVLVQYPLRLQPGEAAYTILFKHLPLYQKLDLTILSPGSPLPFSGQYSIYRKAETLTNHPSTLVAPDLPQPLRTLYSYYLGALRYTKYRKRGQPFSAYKFYRAQLDYFLLTSYQRLAQQPAVASLTMLTYQALDRQAEAAHAHKYLYPADEHAMDNLYMELLQDMLMDKYDTLDELQRSNLTIIAEFIHHELGEEYI